jgi:hypothetical protein
LILVVLQIHVGYSLSLASEDTQANDNLPTIRWIGELEDGPTLGLPKLDHTETVVLYRAAPESGTYSHHGYILHHDGVLYATWSNHARDEDAPGQRVLMSRSRDDGRTWEPFAELFPPQDDVKPASKEDPQKDRVLIANGIAVAEGKVYAVAEMHVLADRRGLGRLAREVPPVGEPGPIFWLKKNSPRALPGFSAYPPASDARFSTLAGKINAYLAEPEHLPSWEFERGTSRPKAVDHHQLCEPTQAWKLKDETLVRMYRDLGTPRSGRNYAQFSRDGGETWTKPVPTEFPDACSRSAAGMLPDGTVYVINNPGRSRDPLVISLARDGLTFDRHAVIACDAPEVRHAGRWKGKGFQYPRATLANKSLFVIYSVGKEDMRVTRIPLEELKALPSFE